MKSTIIKQSIASLILLLTFQNEIQAQKQLSHSKKMYRNEAGRLFANKHQAMYLMLSTSPGANGDTQALESESAPKYANPFYFDSEGLNTIRTPSQVDPETKELVYPIADVVFEIYADGLAPVTTALFKGAKKYLKNDTVYYGPGLQLIFSPKDKTSGVESVYYSINGSDYKKYDDSISISDEKTYTLKYYSVDNVGNVEEIKEKLFTIDKTAPTTNWKLAGDVSGHTVSKRSKIELAAMDKCTGVDKIQYQINDGPILTYKQPIAISSIEGNNHDFKFWAVDKVGNRSDGNSHMDDIAGKGASSFSFVIDYDPPEAKASILNDQFQGDKLYVSERSLCVLEAKDNQLVVDRIMYGANKLTIDKTFNEAFAFDNTKELQYVYYEAFDMVENKSKRGQLEVFMDNMVPMTGIDFKGPQFFTRDTLFINSTTTIKLFAEDNASGIQKTISSINGQPEQTLTSFKIEKDGWQQIAFHSVDNVNNVETSKQSEVYVDNEGPEVFINFSIKPTRQENLEGQIINVYPPFVKLYIGATDKHCGTQNILYGIDGGTMKNYGSNGSPASSELFKEEKVYQVDVEASDKLGNKNLKTLNFRISKN